MLHLGSITRAASGSDERSIRVEYDRAGRFNSPMSMRVYISGAASSDDLVRLWLDADYLQGVEIAQVSPAPAAVEAAPDRLIYVFKLDKPHRPSEVTFTLKASQVGEITGKVGLVGGQSLLFSQFIDP